MALFEKLQKGIIQKNKKQLKKEPVIQRAAKNKKE